MTAVLGTLALAGCAVTTGVLFAVAISLVPVFLALPPDRYVEVHRVAGRRFDRFMPPTVVTTAAAEVALAVLSGPAVVFGAAALCLAGVSLVSQFGNVPINRVVKALPAGGPPPGWDDPRRRWRALHRWRTALAAAALVCTAVGLVAGRW